MINDQNREYKEKEDPCSSLLTKVSEQHTNKSLIESRHDKENVAREGWGIDFHLEVLKDEKQF